ncbi:hypothetical protein ACFVTM_08815 [Arthrobacter sp. NPDC058130]|uniref:hypothetical protein n=1 Tax=Arthrobacter sp. NPDC058130 TaxID=3346353 RepID=UPI0036EB6868
MYVNNRTGVTITCDVHGDFQQAPDSHLQGSGCIDCVGVRKHTAETFTVRAREIHGAKYEYDLVEYVDSKTKVSIVCAEHGAFKQTPNNHMNGSGCPACAGRLRRDTDAFIRLASEVHEGRYGYEDVVYTTSGEPVKIRCSEHGVFEQVAYTHLTGAGCRHCAGNVLIGTSVFITRARARHGDRYDYHLVDYTGTAKHVDIVCKQHGVFRQIANNHLDGQGCRDCSGLTPLGTAEFIRRAQDVHGDKYDYQLVEYVNMTTKVTIRCPEKHSFEQSPGNHLSGGGCWACSGRMRHTNETFAARAVEVHGQKYGYALVEYIDTETRVTITCPKHGDFQQTPHSHLSGSGCLSCRLSGSGCLSCRVITFTATKPERTIAGLLEAAGIPFTAQWRNPTLRHKGLLRFDFMLPDDEVLIEYDGPFHHSPQYWRYPTETEAEEAHENQRIRDLIKDQWAMENGWRLLRLADPATIEHDLRDAGVLRQQHEHMASGADI